MLADLQAGGIDPGLVHAANSAGALAHPRARYSLVRAGIATYGIAPGPGVADVSAPLRPALALKTRVGFVKRTMEGADGSISRRAPQVLPDPTVSPY